jgi:hypothetical protein
LIIDQVEPAVKFQNNFSGSPVNAALQTHQRIQTPVGDLQVIRLSFGPQLTWLYAYLDTGHDQVASVNLNIELSHRLEMLVDDTFPFEFSLPLQAEETDMLLGFTVKSLGGAAHAINARLGSLKP